MSFESDKFSPPALQGSETHEELLEKLMQQQEFIAAVQRDLLQLSTNLEADNVSFDPASSTLVATDVQAAIDELDGDVTTVETDLSNLTSTVNGIADIPPKGIIDFYGTLMEIPVEYSLCDGTGGTPDLRDQFVIGAGGALAVGAAVGSLSKTTSSDGSHSHTITVGNRTLSVSQMPSHRHSYPASSSNTGAYGSADGDGNNFTDYTNYEGGGGSHNHSGSSNSTGSHSHSITDVRPPAIALYKIMRD